MLSKKSTREIGRIFQFFFVLGMSPLYWNRKNERLEMTKSKRRYWFWKSTALIFVLYGPYTLLSFLYRCTHRTFANTSDLIMHLMWCAAFPTIALTTIRTLMHISELQEYVNQIIRMDQLLSGRYKNAWKTPNRDIMASLLPQTIPLVLGNLASIVLIYFVDMDNPRFFASILVPFGRYLIVIRFLSEVLSHLQLYFVLFVIWVMFFAVFSTIINHWIRAIRNASSEFFRNPQPKLLERSHRTYRQLQVLTVLYNSCLSALVWPSFILCNLSTHCLCIYIAVKLLGEVFPVIAILYTFWTVHWFIIDFTIFPHMGKMKELSLDYLHRMKVARMSKLDKKLAASLQPLSVKVGNFFTMDKITVLIIVVIVSNLTINALLLI